MVCCVDELMKKITKFDLGRSVTPKLCYYNWPSQMLMTASGGSVHPHTAPFGLGYIKWEIVWRFPSHFVWRSPQRPYSWLERERNPTTWSYTRVPDHLHVDRGLKFTFVSVYSKLFSCFRVLHPNLIISNCTEKKKSERVMGRGWVERWSSKKNGTCK